MGAAGVLIIFLVIIVVMGIATWQVTSAWPVVRGRLHATWPVTGKIEGFIGASELSDTAGLEGVTTGGGINSAALKAWLPVPESLIKKNVGHCPRVLNDAGNYEAGIGKPYKSYDLLSDWLPGKPEPRVAGGPTSQECYKVDWARGLERAGSYAQRTNNFIHGYPDSCSAPRHELILDYYQERPTEAPYQV
jgi:hypothetical protein